MMIVNCLIQREILVATTLNPTLDELMKKVINGEFDKSSQRLFKELCKDIIEDYIRLCFLSHVERFIVLHGTLLDFQ